MVIFFIIFLTNKVICWLQFKQNALNVSLKAMRQINFTENLHWAGNATMFFIIKEAKETLLDFSQRSLKVLFFFSSFNIYQYKTARIYNLNFKLCNPELKKLKSAIKIDSYESFVLSAIMVGESNDETNFVHILLANNRQVPKLRKVFTNNLLGNAKLSKTQNVWNYTMRPIFWQTYWINIKNWTSFNEKYT